jgi:hypothetical protein
MTNRTESTLRSGASSVAGWLGVMAAWLILAGCVEPRSEPAATAAPPRSSPPPARPLPALPEPTESSPGRGVAVLVSGLESLVPGMDGSLYEAYAEVAVLRTQDALRRRGLYHGPLNGVLDRPTMQAIYDFQSASLGLDRSGIPTPRTRLLLEQGSHTF